MTRSTVKLGLMAVVATVAGCSDNGSSDWSPLFVQGTVSQGLSVDNAVAVAIGDDGRTVWTALDAQRNFTLLLPLGHSYQIVIASELPDGHQMKVGHLVLPVASGTSTWLGANEGGTVDLGVLHPSSTAAVTAYHQSSDGGGRDGDDDWGSEGDHSHDNGCHQGGGHGGGVCRGDHDEELKPTKDPGSRCQDHGSHGHGGDGDDDGDKPCPPQSKDAGVDADGSSGVPLGGECTPDGGSLVCAPPNTCDPMMKLCVAP
jgi:hypothetical protein